MTSNYIELTEYEIDDYLRHMDRKTMFKDHGNKEDVANGAILTPLYTLSSSHFWMKRNLVVINETGEYVYASGSNIIVNNPINDTQKILSLQSDCYPSSLYTEISSTGERIIIVGEKVRPEKNKNKIKNETYKNEIILGFSGRVEIFNLDQKVMMDRRVLDHAFYSDYNNFIYDAVVPYMSELCLTIVKNNHTGESDTKVFVWDYVSINMLTYHEFDHHIESIVCNKIDTNKFIFFSLYYCALWEYYPGKKKLISQNIYVNDLRDVSDAVFINCDRFEGIAISYRSTRVEFYSTNHQIYKAFNLNDVYSHISKKFSNLINIKENHTDSVGEVHNESSMMENISYADKSHNTDNKSHTNTVTNFNNTEINEELIKDTHLFLHHDYTSLIKNFKIDSKNIIKFIIPRDRYLFVFFSNTDVYFVLEFIENMGIKLNCIEKTGKKIIGKSFIYIDTDINQMILINGGEGRSLFMNKFDETKNSIFLQHKEKRGAKVMETTKNLETNFKIKMPATTTVFEQHQFEKVSLRYYSFKINFDNNMPLITYDSEMFPQTGIGKSVTSLTLSANPRYILSGFDDKQLVIHQQMNIDEINESHINNSHYNYIDKTNVRMKINSSLDPFSSQMNNQHNFLAKNTKLNYIGSKKFENTPLSITISPYASNFFITFEDTSYLYTILDKEIKELAKINSYCQIACFSNSGKYLAFGNCDIKPDPYNSPSFNIIIINTNTYNIEYIIIKLPRPVKIKWMDNDKKLLALFDDNTVNILGWDISEGERLTVYDGKEPGNMNKDKNNQSDIMSNINGGSTQKSDVTIKDSNLIIRITDYAAKIVDFVYDNITDYLLIISEEKIVKIFQASLDDAYWDFYISGCIYTSVLLVKKLDLILFGTSEGSIRLCLWPISNYTKKEQIDHPSFTEKFIHLGKVTHLSISSDLKFIYSAADDGTIYISSLVSYSNDICVSNSVTFNYFDMRNILPKKVHMKYSDLILLTDAVYRGKLEDIDKREVEIQTVKSEFMTKLEKYIGENAKEVEKKGIDTNDAIEKKRRDVKRLEDDKETLSKNLKEKRENQLKHFREEIKQIKTKYKIEKDLLQTKTKSLANLIKDVKINFSTSVTQIEARRDVQNGLIKTNLDNLLEMLREKSSQILLNIKMKKTNFYSELNVLEEKFESNLRGMEQQEKIDFNRQEIKTKEMETDIMKTKKDNKNYFEKIQEWETHLKELKNNNTDLMESFLFNTLKLKQMSQLLIDNETKITDKEQIVKQKRTVNDRLEQLRYVLEYQIKNLIKEKTPIEEQIKNFEELHNDFYKRFNLLYAEQLNIDEFINNNQLLIEDFKDKLANKKSNLYYLKNIFRNIDVEIHFIFTTKIEDKNIIVNKLVDVYNKYMKDYIGQDLHNGPETTQDARIRGKIIEKEINKQKNKVLKDLIIRRQDRKDINTEKEDLMLSIRLENEQLIEECSSIRVNLEDILKYISDIEKKFIELTNTHLFLHKSENTKLIREDIKLAKQSIMLGDDQKTKIAKGNMKNEPVAGKAQIYHQSSNNNISNNEMNSHGKSTQGSILKNESIIKSNAVPKFNLIKQMEDNKEEMVVQNKQIEKMHQKIKELIGMDQATVSKISSNLNTIYDNKPTNKNKKQKNTKPVTGMNNDKLKNSRLLTIKSKYFDSSTGELKNVINSEELYK